MEATQNPVTLSAVEAPSGPPAWAHIPSWDVVGTIDKAIPEAAQMFMANRAHAHITEVHAGHLSMVSSPLSSPTSSNRPPRQPPEPDHQLGQPGQTYLARVAQFFRATRR